jgi:hypothetical protein
LRISFARLNIPICMNITLLDSMLPSRFSVDTPLTTIVDVMMVEHWNLSTNYSKFYHICQPAYCSFTYEERSNIVYVITTVIGFFGGLNIILRLISFFLVKIFIKRSNIIYPDSSLQSDTSQHMYICNNIFDDFISVQELVLLSSVNFNK